MLDFDNKEPFVNSKDKHPKLPEMVWYLQNCNTMAGTQTQKEWERDRIERLKLSPYPEWRRGTPQIDPTDSEVARAYENFQPEN